MNKLIQLTLLVILSVLLAACGQATQNPNEVIESTPSSATPYPSTGEQTGNNSAYPGPGTTLQIISPYPAPQGYEQAKYVSLSEIERYIEGGQAAEIIVTVNQEAYVKLSDGTAVWINSITADAITQIIATCGDACKDIPLTLP
jgi:hypothetical protein